MILDVILITNEYSAKMTFKSRYRFYKFQPCNEWPQITLLRVMRFQFHASYRNTLLVLKAVCNFSFNTRTEHRLKHLAPKNVSIYQQTECAKTNFARLTGHKSYIGLKLELSELIFSQDRQLDAGIYLYVF